MNNMPLFTLNIDPETWRSSGYVKIVALDKIDSALWRQADSNDEESPSNNSQNFLKHHRAGQISWFWVRTSD